MNDIDHIKIKKIIEKLKIEGFHHLLVCHWQTSENAWRRENNKSQISDVIDVYFDNKIGWVVGFSSFKGKNESLFLRVVSACSLDEFYCFYIQKNMDFEEIIQKRIIQIGRKKITACL